jgi:hypothetical protein
MRGYRVRVARMADAGGLADLHFYLLSMIPGGILKALGRPFRREYYRIMLAEPRSLILCLESGEGNMVGLATGSLDAAEHAARLTNRRLRLAWAALPAVARKPSLIRSLLAKQNTRENALSDNGYVVSRGPRLEFWGVTKEGRAGGRSLLLLQTWLSMAKLLGAESVRFEVNDSESEVATIHRRLGAREEKRFITPDGIPRIIMKYEL